MKVILDPMSGNIVDNKISLILGYESGLLMSDWVKRILLKYVYQSILKKELVDIYEKAISLGNSIFSYIEDKLTEFNGVLTKKTVLCLIAWEFEQ